MCVCVGGYVGREWGRRGGWSPKGNNFWGVGWIQVFSGGCKCDRWDNKNKQLQTDSYFTVSRCFKISIVDEHSGRKYSRRSWKFQGWGWSKTKCPQWGGEGGYGYFLELHMMMYRFSSWPLTISNFNLQPIKYISQIDIPAQLFRYEILQLFRRRSFMGKTAQFSVRFI